jgi:hypothetical protein
MRTPECCRSKRTRYTNLATRPPSNLAIHPPIDQSFFSCLCQVLKVLLDPLDFLPLGRKKSGLRVRSRIVSH